MKKLLLTSEGLTTKKIKDEFIKLVGKPGNEIQVAFIPTAGYPEEDRTWISENRKPLNELKCLVVDVDLKAIKSKTTLYSMLSEVDVIWINGGNTFYLLYWLRKSGSDKMIQNLVGDGIVYVGVSAGSIVASPTIEIAGWKGYDDPSVIKLDSLDGLGLVDVHIFPHYDKNWEILVEENKKKLQGELICLTDKQALVVKNGTCSKIQ